MVLRTNRAHQFFTYGGAHVLLLGMGLQIEGRLGWLIALPLMSVVSLYAWLANLRRLHMVNDMPTSQIASAAQGYVELIGRAQLDAAQPLQAKLSHFDCCWYRYEIEERDSRDEWRSTENGDSAEPFVIKDRTGLCTIDPAGAEVLCARKQVWIEGDYRYTEWRIHGGDQVYALGEFSTRSAMPGPAQAREGLDTILREWKADRSDLLRRFDLDRNGELSMQEWGLARAAAKREVRRDIERTSRQPDIDILARPADGRLFLLSNYELKGIERRFTLWSWAHLLAIFAALFAFIYVLK
jgi:hypothetical protein